MRLRDGSQIAVIGAGPAGTFFTYFVQLLAKERGLNVSITIFDAKNFLSQGPSGCNMCAGVISETLVDKLKEKGIALPAEKVQRKIEGYYYQSRAGGVLLTHLEGRREIITVFRGNGPRYYAQDGNISFDYFLLDLAKEKGAQVVSEPVKKVVLPSHPEQRIRKFMYDQVRIQRSCQTQRPTRPGLACLQSQLPL